VKEAYEPSAAERRDLSRQPGEDKARRRTTRRERAELNRNLQEQWRRIQRSLREDPES